MRGRERAVRGLAVAAAIAAAVGCGDAPVAVGRGEAAADYNRAALGEAIARFVAAGRTVEAYGALAREVDALRPGMDEIVAEIAELQLVTLAVGPVEALRGTTVAERTAALGPTVWPVALAPAVDALAPDGWRSPRIAAVAWQDGESGDAYVRRVCDGPYAVECRHVVPEWQGAVLDAEAIERMTARMRTAVANCEECGEPDWAAVVARWEALDRAAVAAREREEGFGATSRWPVAGAGATAWPDGVPVLDAARADWTVDGDPVDTLRRAAWLSTLRGRGDALGLHVRPDSRVDALADLVAAAAEAGFATVLVVAREPAYPWARRAYPIPASRRPALGRPSDTVQVMLRGLDARAAGD